MGIYGSLALGGGIKYGDGAKYMRFCFCQNTSKHTPHAKVKMPFI